MKTKKTASEFLRKTIESLKVTVGIKDVEIYEKMRMKRSNFYKCLQEGRDIKLGNLPRWRKALGLTRNNFWKRVRDFFDPEE